MNALDRLFIGCILIAAMLFGGVLWVRHYGAEQHQAGYDAAVAAGKEQHDRDSAAARKTESDLRAQLRDKDADALTKEQEYASNLENAQRRVRTGADSLRCPAASAVPGPAAANDRPAAGGLDPDADRPRIVPEVASDLLGIAGDVAGLLRRYQRVVDRFEECRALNAK